MEAQQQQQHPPQAAANNVPDAEQQPDEHPQSMQCYPDEVTRALELQTLARERGLTPLTHFEYLQYSICSLGNDESSQIAVQRMAMMQAFREEYNIRNTLEEGMEILNRGTLDHPGLFLSIDYLVHSRNYATVVDFAASFPSRLKTHEQFRIYMGCYYYLFQAKSCQIEAIRNGSSIICECMGASWDNFDFHNCDKFLHEFYRWYPKLQREMYLLNSPEVVNVAFGMWKKFLTKNQNQTIQLGHQIHGFEGRRLDQLYKIPTAEQGRQNMLAAAKTFLTRRYRHERTFRLPEAPT